MDVTDCYHVSAQDMHLLNGFIERYESSVAKGEGIAERCFPKETCSMIFGDMLDTGEVKDVITDEINKRYAERTKLHPEFKEELEEQQKSALERLNQIDNWMKHFVKDY